MERKGPQDLTETKLNAAVYRYLQESGFAHSAFNFFHEAGIEKGNIQGMIPQGALISVVQKGLQYIELEANSEIGSDDEYHFFDPLDLLTNDLDELRKKITNSAERDSVKNDKDQKIDSVETDNEQKINSVETDKDQKIGSGESTTMSGMKPIWKMKALQNINPDETDKEQKISSGETTTMSGMKPIWKVKALQNINPDETDKEQKIGSGETTTMSAMKPIWKTKALQNINPDETATMRRTHPVKRRTQLMKRRIKIMKHAKAQGIDSEKQNISSAEIAQKVGSAETSAMYRKKPMRKTEAVQNSSPDQTATLLRTQPMKHAKTQGTDSKEQNISAAETAQEISSVKTSTGQAWQLSWIGKKPRLQKRKH
ncbi:hypothetical protein BS78_01G155200 [Paspalum vaginatum]|nr:hypothetical protein BS78_01G155200 [Paspalum vaginatum]